MEIEQCAAAWLAEKNAETMANKQRIAIEIEILKHLKAKDEGSITHAIDGFKVTLTQPITRKLDEKAWGLVASLCPVDLHPIKTKIEPDAVGMKWLAEHKPAIWRNIAQAFEIKPGKVGVKVEVA